MPSVLDDTPSPLPLPSPQPPATPPLTLRAFGDAPTTRKLLFDNVHNSLRTFQPITNGRHTLELADVDYDGPEQYTNAQWKQAILNNESMTRKIRGRWRLTDNVTGQPVAERVATLANVPYLTDDGTFISRGNAYGLSHQMRLSPGSFARRKSNGELEAHVNVLPGKGRTHRIFLEPKTGVFKVNIAQANIPLYPLLRAMGINDKSLGDAWGTDLAAANAMKNDPQAIRKLYDRVAKQRSPTADGPTMAAAVVDAFRTMELDSNVTKHTLGGDFKDAGPDTIMAVTKKLLAISRGEGEEDDRDHLAYQHVVGPEDIMAERLKKARLDLGKALWKASASGSLDKLPTGIFDKAISTALIGSGLGSPLEEINPAEIFDQQSRITRMGEGGISSIDAVPDESRSVQPSHLGFIDFLRTAESSKAGVDLRLARGAMKGSDGKLYTKVRDLRTGEEVFRNSQDLADKILAFPGADPQDEYVQALAGGKLRYVAAKDVDYVLPHMESTFSPLANMIPLKSMVKGQRAVMAARMLTQALPLAEPEAPLVQSGMPDGDDRSFEEEYAQHMGAIRAAAPGQVLAVTPAAVTVQYQDGTKKTHELHENLPFNRKTYLNQTPTVQVGDVLKPGQLLARSNYTDTNGTTGLGKNLSIGYLPFRGLNFEDAVVLSESAATKKMVSEHAYQHGLEFDERLKRGKQSFVGLFPGKYDRKTLENFTDDGLIKKGTTVKFGDPLILGARERETTYGQIHRGRGNTFSDASVTWNHHVPGVVTDVGIGKKGANVFVRATVPMEVGDKLCFDPATSVLTKRGWKNVADVTLDDEIATLNPATDMLEYQHPTHVWKYRHEGQMYYLNTKHVNMLVTLNHKLWVAKPGEAFRAVPAGEFYAAKGEWQFKKDCQWGGVDRDFYEFAPPSRQYATRTTVLNTVCMDDWLEFLGYYLAEGWCSSPGYVKIGQFRKSPHWQKIAANLQALGLKYRYAEAEGRFEIGNVWLYDQLLALGDSYSKFVPGWVQELCPRQLRIFLEAYLCGDGHKGACWEYGSSSERLAVDIQVICLKLGWCVTLKRNDRTDNWQKQPHWRGRINRRHLRPWWKKGRAKTYKSNREELVPYVGDVFCVTVPNHVVYCKREDKTYWSHNSGRYG